MNEQLSIGSCEICSAPLVPEDFNLRGAVRLPDGRVFCGQCAQKARGMAIRGRGPGVSDTAVFEVNRPRDPAERKEIAVTCLECGEPFEVVLEDRSRYVFCPKCGKKMHMDVK